MANNNNGEIKTYGAIRCYTEEGIAAYANQIDWNGKPITKRINENNNESASTGNTNSTSIEGKVNAMIGCLLDLINNVVFHSGTPFVTPQQLQSRLELLRYTYSGTTPAICGSAVCGQTICGVI